jgi:hypothetical protein
MVVTRTITDGRTDDRTMAAGSSVTWTHYSVRYKVTSRINRRVCADALTRSLPPSHPLPSPPLSCLVRTQAAVADARKKKKKLNY